ncbi:hypothetical protein [Flagellimonas allohymeniacidonis]|uniref:Uncharacterized protein n=1 Tax=Flagellimonas allohymeniacidonis TaxID=2517819 RepID=A0A4Q8QGS9_9FLAO|nr:hypothetical protein [Allomuricauda hymeniacidonis]TAI47589.1 hypothetical protein EW142_13055 [Allomuricauda hymeniacidonis]
MESNIKLGCVVYTETEDEIYAEWVFRKDAELERGTGRGIRLTELNQTQRFEGEFEITYTDTNGSTSPKLHLTISFESGTYHLTWKENGNTTDFGIGMVKDNMLLVSYTKAG